VLKAFSISMSTPTMTNGAARNPDAKRNSTNIVRTCIDVFEIKTPAKTPNNIKLIAETHRMKISASFPKIFNSLRKSRSKDIRKTYVHTHSSFVKAIFSKKCYFSDSLNFLYNIFLSSLKIDSFKPPHKQKCGGWDLNPRTPTG
jgi:hypothetical protein